MSPPWRGPGESNGPEASEITEKSRGCWDEHISASKPAGVGTRCMTRTGVEDPPKTHLPQVGGPAYGGERGTNSTQPLLCQCPRLALPAPTTLPSYPALAVPTGQHLPTASTKGIGSDGCDGRKHKKWFPSLQADKEVSHLDMYSSQAGKGTRHGEERSRGPVGAASPRGRGETDGRFGSRVVTERPASSSCCKSRQHNTA